MRSMPRRHATRAHSTSEQNPWAQAAPSVGPGFVSTALRPDVFKAECKFLWATFEDVLKSIAEVGSEDLDCSNLCLPTLKEELDSIVAQKLQAEKQQIVSNEKDELKQTIDKHGSQAKDLDTAGERAGKKDRIDNEDSAPEGEAVADKKPKSFQKRETASKNEESDGRQDAASGQQAKAGKEQPRLRQAKRPAGQGRNIKGRRDESPGKKAQVDKQQPSAAGKERPSQKEVRRKKPSDKEATVGKQHIAASQEQKAASKDEDYLAQLTDLPPVHSVNERSDQAEDAFASNAKRGIMQPSSPARCSRRTRNKPDFFAPSPFAPGASAACSAGKDSKQDKAGSEGEPDLLEKKRERAEPSQGDNDVERMPAKDGQKIEAEAGEEPPLKKKKRAKPSQEELEYSRNHQKSRAENSKEEQTAKAEDERKGTKHWRPSQDAPPKVTQAENVASNALQAGRCKQKGGDKNTKRRHPQQIGGEGKELEEKRRKAFQESAQDLRSVAEALKVPALHCTAFQIRPDSHCDDSSSSEPASPSGKALDEDETILRIEIREFDVLHSTQQEFLVPGSQKMKLLRDRIHCPADDNLQSLGMTVQGAFFYIEGVFYVDRRPSAQDYVSNILDFCEAHDIPPPPEVGNEAEAFPDEKRHFSDVDRQANSSYRQMDMAHLCWNEIGLRVGPAAKNVFCHQGCCEHLLVVKDVRRRHPDDPTHHSSYPYLIQEDAPTKRLCNICSELVAKKVTYDDKNAPQEPAFWCKLCYDLMHYDGSNTLLYDHKVFDYQGG